MATLGIDLGGTKLALALFAPDGAVLARDTAVVAGRSGAEVGALIVERARGLVPAEGALDAVGVAVPGIFHADRGTVWAPNIPGWEDYPLHAELVAAFGDGTAVSVESDRAAYIAGETWRGAAAGCRNAVFLAVGTGIGAGLMVDGRIVHGLADIAGAVGWLALDRPYRAEYVECGQFEHHASGPGLVKCARALMAREPDYRGALGDGELTTAHIFTACDAGDSIATRVVDDAIAFWGMAAANLVSLLNPAVVVFGGGVFGPAVQHLGRIRDEAARWAQPIAMRQVAFLPSSLGSDAGLYGAACLAMQARVRAPAVGEAAPSLEPTPP